MRSARSTFVLLLLAVLLCALVGATSAGAASQAQINASIVSGVNYLVPLQSTGGAPTGAWPCDEFYAANTGFAVAVLEHYAEHLGKTPLDASYAYHANVQAGLDYLFSSAVYDATNHLVSWNQGVYDSYETGPCLMAIARSGTPDAVVSGGTALDGFTYKQVAQMVVDWLATQQLTTGTATGGWCYTQSWGYGDQSATGWVGMGLGYAAHSMGCTLPADMIARLSTWNDYIQNHTAGLSFGGAGYGDPADWVNVYKTGHLLFNQSLCGDTVATQRVQDALTFMTVHWADKTNGYLGSPDDYGWRGDPANGLAPSYIGMATAMKGFTALNIQTFNGIDWYNDFSDVIVATQYPDGHWVGGGWDEAGAPHRSTCWALLTLLKGSTYVPPQIVTHAATSLTSTSATLQGSLEALGSSTTVNVSFQYGTASGTYTSETAPAAKTATGAFNAAVSGLTPGATYYFRAKAAGEATAYGEELSFTTPTNVVPPAPPAPPSTVVKGVFGTWVRHAVNLRFVATPAPGGAPVAYTEYRVGTGQWTHGTKVTIHRQGVTEVDYRSADTLGTIETAHACKVRIDGVAPVVRDFGHPVSWVGGTLSCDYKVTDAISSRVTTKLAVTRYHVPIKQYKLGVQPSGKRLTARVTCRLGTGTWCWRVVAFDQAGNRGVGSWHFFEAYPSHRR